MSRTRRNYDPRIVQYRKHWLENNELKKDNSFPSCLCLSVKEDKHNTFDDYSAGSSRRWVKRYVNKRIRLFYKYDTLNQVYEGGIYR